MSENKLIKYNSQLIKKVGDVISITNKLLDTKDFTPLNIGIDEGNGLMSIIIPANTIIPVKKSHIFSTKKYNQTTIRINLLQGFSNDVNKNKNLAIIDIENIPLAPSGVVQIEVIFQIDMDGILHVSANDKQLIVHFKKSTGGLSKREIEEMKVNRK